MRGAVSSIRMIGISAIYLDDDDDGDNDDDIAWWDTMMLVITEVDPFEYKILVATT